MKSLILLFLLSTVSLSGTVAVTENDPSTLVEGIVNIITGDLYALEDDIIVQGAEPLRLRRSYISGKGGTGWHFFENLTATLRPPSRILTVNEPSGTSLIYHYDLKVIGKQEKHKKKKEEPVKEQKQFHPLNVNHDAQGLTNTARGKIVTENIQKKHP